MLILSLTKKKIPRRNLFLLIRRNLNVCVYVLLYYNSPITYSDVNVTVTCNGEVILVIL